MTAETQNPEKPASRPILFYDGECGLCARSVQFVLHRDPEHRFQFAPLQGSTAQQTLPALHTQDVSSVVFHHAGQNWRRSAAAVRVLWTLGGKWKACAAALWLIPAPVRDLAYRLIARYRHRLFPAGTACLMPTEQQRQQMLP